MITIPKEITRLLNLTSDGKIYIYIALFLILSYLLISLLTWSFIKPLKYLGIPTIITGTLFIIIRFSSSVLINLIETTSNISLIRTLLPSVLKPVLLTGIISLLCGIVMIVVYKLLNKKRK